MMNTNSYLKKLQDRLIETFFKYKKALNALDDVIERLRHTEDKDLFPYFRDSLIQRFEFSVELLWKLLKVYLEYFYGIQCNSPKGCVKEAYKVGLIKDLEIFFDLIYLRNLTSHIYGEEEIGPLVDNILKLKYLFNEVYNTVKQSIESIE